MNSSPLIGYDEAFHAVAEIPNPLTRDLTRMALVHIVKEVSLTKSDAPDAPLDLAFLVRTLTRFFSDHDVIERTLAGEKVGAWFDDGTNS